MVTLPSLSQLRLLPLEAPVVNAVINEYQPGQGFAPHRISITLRTY